MSRLHRLYELVLIRTYRCMQCNWPFREFAFNVRLVRGTGPQSQPNSTDD